METRRFGRTGHMSTVAIFGAAAFSQVSQDEADEVMEWVMKAGVNHIDVAPSYGNAELRLGPWLARERERFFLGCKTTERGREGALAELERSLERLQTDRFDLYQIHAVTSLAELDQATAPGGVLEAIVAAREQGLTRYIGITGHGVAAPAVFREALRRFDFDSVLFPLNFVLYANPTFRREAEALIAECRARDVGTMVIKAITRGPWGSQPHTHATWYQPFEDRERIGQAVSFALSQDITGLCTAGDCRLLPLFLEACADYRRFSPAEQERLIAAGAAYEPLFA
jgi:aryl-alcohol dehydrogenase-like predicted oxidoreductase